MSVTLLKTDFVNRCPRHVPDASHYIPEGCLCPVPGKLTVKQTEERALALPCPVCAATPGNPCLNQNSTRKIQLLKHPHPERMRLVNPEFRGNFQKRGAWRVRKVAGAGWEQSDSRKISRAKARGR